MKTMHLSAVVAAILAIPTVPAWAQGTARIDQRQINQERRIEQGVQSGQLTGKEAEKLEHGQARVQVMETRAKADGTVTAKEGSRIEHAQDQQSRKIEREKHDRQHDLNHDGRMDRPHRGPKR